MSWQTEMTSLLRYVVNDSDPDDMEYSDDRLQRAILSAAQLTFGVVDFPRTYEINVSSSGITPDPTSENDTSFINLVVLKAACILAIGDFNSSVDHGVVIRDGPSMIDARPLVSSKKQIMDEYCQQYDEAELDFRLGNSNAGEAIIGPHRNAIYGGASSSRNSNTR